MTSPVDFTVFTPTLDGGVGKVLCNLLNGFAARGKKVDLFLLSSHGEYIQRLSPNIHIHNLNVSRTIFALPKLVQYLKKIPTPSLLTVSFHANITALLAKQISSSTTRVVVSEHIALSHALETLSPVRRFVLTILIRLLYPTAHAVISVSSKAAANLQTIVPNIRAIQTIYNPVINQELYTLATDQIAHPWLQDHTIPVLVAVGRLTKQKDFATLLRAFALLQQQQPARLIILGEGEERSALTALCSTLKISSHVDLIGYTQNPYPYMKKCDLFVLSSTFEGLPTVLIEALALAPRIVSTDCPSGPREILADGTFGELTPVGDAEKLARAIAHSLQRPPISKKLEFLRPFEVDQAVDAYLKVL